MSVLKRTVSFFCILSLLLSSAGLKAVSKPFVLGDIDGNGNITVTDIVMLRKLITENQNVDESLLLVSDINLDGKLTVSDIVGLRKLIMGEFDLSATANELLTNIYFSFWNSDTNAAYENIIKQDYAYLWPYVAYIEALSAGVRANPESEILKNRYIIALNSLENYSAGRDYICYSPGFGGYGDIYYDDNIWIVIAFIRAYELLEDDKWLEKAEQLGVFCYSGWDESTGGGVRWRETNNQFKAMCSTAPMAYFSSILYKYTGKSEYLDWAKKAYNWARENMLDTDGLYFNEMHYNGYLDKTKWTVNAGCMLSASVLLYEITGDSKYLAHAKQTAYSADEYFGSSYNGIYYFYTAEPWFHTWLLEGYIALSKHTDTAEDYINNYSTAVINAVNNHRTTDGFVYRSWTGIGSTEINLIDQSGTATALYMLKTHNYK